jgi:hypothetical protein
MKLDSDKKTVSFFSPLFKGISYRQAQPISDYEKTFSSALPKDVTNSIFSCSCILNYLNAKGAGSKTAALVGPITFGEIAYQFLNQTLVYLTVHDKKLN